MSTQGLPRITKEEARVAAEPYFNKIAGMTTSAEIRDFLVSEGVHGVRSDANSCPLARYFRRETDMSYQVGARSVMAFVRSGYHEELDVLLAVVIGELTLAMREFTADFDCGYFPELEAHRPEDIH